MENLPNRRSVPARAHFPPLVWLYPAVIATFVGIAILVQGFSEQLSDMMHRGGLALIASSGIGMSQRPDVDNVPLDLSWYPPKQTQINNLTAVIEGEGVYGYIYNSSDTPDDLYGVYNWCNMPHVRKREYVRPGKDYELVYVEVVSTP